MLSARNTSSRELFFDKSQEDNEDEEDMRDASTQTEPDSGLTGESAGLDAPPTMRVQFQQTHSVSSSSSSATFSSPQPHSSLASLPSRLGNLSNSSALSGWMVDAVKVFSNVLDPKSKSRLFSISLSLTNSFNMIHRSGDLEALLTRVGGEKAEFRTEPPGESHAGYFGNSPTKTKHFLLVG